MNINSVNINNLDLTDQIIIMGTMKIYMLRFKGMTPNAWINIIVYAFIYFHIHQAFFRIYAYFGTFSICPVVTSDRTHIYIYTGNRLTVSLHSEHACLQG